MNVRPPSPPGSGFLHPQTFWRGWAGLAMVAAGAGAAALLPPVPVAAPAPARIAVVQPARGPVGIRVVLEGQGLVGARSVAFGTQPAEFRVADDGRVETHVPVGAETAPITLVTAEGRVCVSGSAFQVRPEPPDRLVLAGFRPQSGPGGTEVSLEGTGFEAVEAVRVGGRPAEFTMLTDRTMVVYVPAEQPRSGPIALASPFGQVASRRTFQVTAGGAR